MNLPGTLVSTPALTEKDRNDLEFGLRQGVDFIALSFVRRSADITELKELIAECGAHTPVVAKLEKPQAIDSLDDILRVADAVMIARGDLGVELSPERVPFLQKEILTRAASHRVPVITATRIATGGRVRNSSRATSNVPPALHIADGRPGPGLKIIPLGHNS